MKKHVNGTGARYLRGRAPLKLAYLKKYNNSKDALREEIEIKKKTKNEKEKLIKSLTYTNYIK